MRALILAGGKGTRLRPLTVYTPKPIVPIVNRPFLTYQLDLLRDAGISDVTLSLSYQPDKIEDVLGDGSEQGVKLNFITEPSALGTAGAVRFAIKDPKGPLLVLNGDILTNVNISDMIATHLDRKDDITIALTRVEDPSKYGLVSMNGDGAVESFIEKPAEGSCEGPANTINAGIYILEPPALELIPKGANSSFEYEVFPAALLKRLRFSGFLLEKKYWRDIGTPQSYLAAHLDILAGKMGFDLGDLERNAETSPTALIESSIIGEGCVIKPNAKIANSVLGPGVHVEEKAVIENSILWAHTRVSQFAKVRGSVIAKGCHIGKDAELRAGSVLGDRATIPDYSVV